MSGIAGYFGRLGAEKGNLLENMSFSVRRSKASFSKWSDESFGVVVAYFQRGDAQQPVWNEDRSILLAMNGDVFDYERQKTKLLKAGHIFKDKMNPAEFCLHFYEEKGENAFRQLNGDFCMVIYNSRKNEIMLISDKFSSYPLYYSITKEGLLLFGSSLVYFAVSKEINRELDIKAIFEYFCFAQVLTTKTFYKDVQMLAPAAIIRYSNGQINSTQYWRMQYQEEKRSEDFYVDKMAFLLKQAVSRRTRDNNRMGILLSGGMDSRMLLAASDTEMACFTFGDIENREVRIAEELSKIKGWKHFFLKRDPEHYTNLIDEAADIGDGMYCFSNAHGIGFFDQISSECDVLWHGYALEKYFRGTYLPWDSIKLLGEPIRSSLSRLSERRLDEEIRGKYRTSLFKFNPYQLFTRKFARDIDGSISIAIKDILDEANKCCSCVYDKFIWLNTRYCRGFAFLSVTSIRKYMKERNIVSDNDLIDLHLSMPFPFRSNNEIWNKVLLKLNQGIARVVNANNGCSPFAPESIVWFSTMLNKGLNKFSNRNNPRLQGAVHPTRGWPDFALLLKFSPKMQKEMHEVITNPEFLPGEIFDTQNIDRVYRDYMAGRKEYAIFLYLLLTFSKWYRRYGPDAII